MMGYLSFILFSKFGFPAVLLPPSMLYIVPSIYVVGWVLGSMLMLIQALIMGTRARCFYDSLAKNRDAQPNHQILQNNQQPQGPQNQVVLNNNAAQQQIPLPLNVDVWPEYHANDYGLPHQSAAMIGNMLGQLNEDELHNFYNGVRWEAEHNGIPWGGLNNRG